MKHTIRRWQNQIINQCEPQGHKTVDGLIVETYINKKTQETFEITYDSDTTPLQIKNVTTGQTMERD